MVYRLKKDEFIKYANIFENQPEAMLMKNYNKKSPMDIIKTKFPKE